MANRILILSLLIAFFTFGCFREQIKFPNLKLSIKYDRTKSGYNDQLYELDEDGALTVTVCKLKQSSSFEYEDTINSRGQRAICRFASKTINLTHKQKRIIRDLLSKLMEKETFAREVHVLDTSTNYINVNILIDNCDLYRCTYTEDYDMEKNSELYPSEILDITYRFIDFVNLEPRPEKDDNYYKNNYDAGYTIYSSILHSHNWK